jgi:regulator of nucleoside diphosphate kinase
MQTLPSIIISANDAQRLQNLLDSAAGEASVVAAALEAELERAEIREPASMPPDVVTMNSRVLCIEEGSGAEHVIRLVYPADADVSAGDVSVLAPVGAALLGLSAGQSIEWPVPGGRTTRIRVSRLLFQPESAGIFD